MQAKLPDINAAIVTHRNNMLHAFDDGNYSKVLLSWSAINSLLPEDYKVEINSRKFFRLVSENKIIICESCKKDTSYQEIHIENILLSTIQNMLTGKQYEKVWYCPKCNKENIFDQKQIKLVKFQEPYYTEVIPEPPLKQFGLSDRSSYDTKFKQWFIRALDEIESKIGKYRADYLAQEASGENVPILDEEHESQ